MSARLVACAFAAAALGASAQDDLELEDFEVPTSLWDKSLNLRGALGYKDNILLSNSRPDESAFGRRPSISACSGSRSRME